MFLSLSPLLSLCLSGASWVVPVVASHTHITSVLYAASSNGECLSPFCLLTSLNFCVLSFGTCFVLFFSSHLGCLPVFISLY